MQAALPQHEPPLVSLCIPTHERPDYLRLALESACAQTYPALEIVVTDNSATDASLDAVQDLLARHPNVRFLRCPDKSYYMDNWQNGLAACQGEYISFLMDDDLYHPTKVARMVGVFEANPECGLVTSHRQLIGPRGEPLPELPGTEHQFPGDAMVNGDDWSRQILLTGRNVIGEPTTVLMRRSDLGAAFGFCMGRQLQVLSDIATWVRLIRGRKAAYLHDSLSPFRLHEGQDQRRSLQALWANVEWLQLLLDADNDGLFDGHDDAVRASLQGKLDGLVPFITRHAAALCEQGGPVDSIPRLLRQALDRLLH